MISPGPDSPSACEALLTGESDVVPASKPSSSERFFESRLASRHSGRRNGGRKNGRLGTPIALPPLTPLAFLQSLGRRWKLALTISIPLAILAMGIAWFVLPAHYTAYVLLRMAEREPRLVFQTAEGPSDFPTYRQTQMALLRSRFVLNAALRRPGIAELTLVRSQQYPVQWLQNHIQVGAGDSPEILEIALTGDRPEELAAIVNAVKDAYLDEVVLAERKQRVARLNDLERIFEQTEDKVRQKEDRVSNLAKELGSGDSKALTIKQQMALEYFAQLQREHSRVRFELMREQVNGPKDESLPVSSVLPESGKGLGSAATELQDVMEAADVSADARVTVAARRITQLKQLIARYERQVINKDHPALSRYRKELADLEDMVAGSGAAGLLSPKARQNRTQLLKRQEQLLGEEVDKYSQLVKNIGTSSFELESMQSEIDQIAKVSNRVGTEMEALRIELQSPPRVTLLQEAEVPQTRDMVRKSRLTGAAGFGVFGLVLLGVGLLEFCSHRISQPKEITETLGLELLGTLPAMPSASLAVLGASRESRTALWNNALIESVDSIRSILVHHFDDASAKVIMIGSATSGEGKTTFACQLAGSLARSGRKTVLVDCDLRRPRVHHLLNVDVSPGLSDYLNGREKLENVIRPSAETELSIIPSGRADDATLRKLAREGGRTFFNPLREEFDFVIVDSSPLLYVADSATCVEDVDGIILAIRQSVSRLPVVSAACTRLALLDAPVLGAVMVGLGSNLHGYGYAYDYHYSYGSRRP